ncbi:MAG TPA: phage antirepressor KilAC domain-containing protein [Candidatus Coprovivens excrementavium]|nr:phage antirepressor KilAC domain-containing protein [Candidatus Coprovivens excrementavium]
MKNLIELRKNNDGSIAVSGRELHKGLEIGTRYNDWIERMLKYGFEENIDYIVESEKVHAQKRVRTYEQSDHIMTLDMAKEIAMIQRSEIGKQIRKYFIEVEKEHQKLLDNQPKDSYMIDDPVERAKRWIEEAEQRKALETKTQEQAKQIEQDKPKVLFADTLASSNNSILIGELAKLITQGGYPIGQNKLFKWLRDNGFLCKSGERYNLPTQYSIDMNLLDIKKRVINNSDGSSRVTRTTKVTGKGQNYFVNKFIKGNEKY